MYVVDSPKRQEEAVNTGRQSPNFFDQFYGLFYMPTGTQDRWLDVPFEGQLGFIGAQSGVRVIFTQDRDTMAHYKKI